MMRGAILLLMLVVCGSAPAADLYVVVHARNPVMNLSRRDVVALFTGRTRSFPGGGLAQAYDHPGKSSARADFYRILTGMDVARINSYWARLQFSGQVQAPLELADNMSVASRVRDERMAIGYLTAPPQDPALRVVFVLREAEAGMYR